MPRHGLGRDAAEVAGGEAAPQSRPLLGELVLLLLQGLDLLVELAGRGLAGRVSASQSTISR
ncbi:MAG: hypothetical protein ACRELU_00225 [Gemmatimonadota bacterium]